MRYAFQVSALVAIFATLATSQCTPAVGTSFNLEANGAASSSQYTKVYGACSSDPNTDNVAFAWGGNFASVGNKVGGSVWTPGSGLGAIGDVSTGQSLAGESWQRAVAVTYLTTGRYVVAYKLGSGSSGEYKGRVMNSDGTAFTSEFDLHSFTTGEQTMPNLATLPNGRFAFIFASSHAVSPTAIYGTVFEESGAVVTSPEAQRLDTDFTTGCNIEQVSTDVKGSRLVMAWMPCSGAGGKDNYYKAFDIDASGAFTSRFTAATGHTAGQSFDQGTPAVALLDDQETAITMWEEPLGSAGDGDSYGILGQVFSASTGAKIGTNFVVNVNTAGPQVQVRVSGKGTTFAMVWRRLDVNPKRMAVRAYEFSGGSLSAKTGEIDVTAIFDHTTTRPCFVSEDEILLPYGQDGTNANPSAISVDLGCIAPTPAPPSCSCVNTLTANYTSDRIPDAAKDAYSEIVLNENTWEVEFTVRGVVKLTNGHVIASKVNTHATAQTAFTPYISSWNAGQLWNPPACALSDIDTPASGLGIAVTNHFNCTRDYKVIFSLVDAAKQNDHCDLNVVGENIVVNCSIILTSTRAYDGTEPTAFLGSETSFSAEITMPNNLNEEVANLLYSTQAKCSVLNGPLFALDCRVPGQWTFGSTFTSVSNIQDFIDASSCVQSQTATATFVRCGLNSVPVASYTEVDANISATVVTPPAGQPNTGSLTFSLQYTLPRAASATASASLQNFIVSITTLNGKYYYAGADRLTLLIETFDTSRLEITQLEMFNSDSPIQSYDLRSYPQFQLSETSNATHFIIEFRPSAIRQDSNFYRHGPHGVNVSFLFTAASGRRMASQDVGYVTLSDVRVEGPTARDGGLFAAEEGTTTAGQTASATASTTLIAVVAACVGTLILGVVVVGVLVARRRAVNANCEPTKDDAAAVSEEQV